MTVLTVLLNLLVWKTQFQVDSKLYLHTNPCEECHLISKKFNQQASKVEQKAIGHVYLNMNLQPFYV